METTESQLRNMIVFATKAEKAYRAVGKTTDANQAKTHREKMEKEYQERFSNEKKAS